MDPAQKINFPSFPPLLLSSTRIQAVLLQVPSGVRDVKAA